MQEPKSLLAIMWSAFWLVVLGSIALWLAGEIMSRVWGWLVLGAVLAAGIALLAVWLKRRSNRW